MTGRRSRGGFPTEHFRCTNTKSGSKTGSDTSNEPQMLMPAMGAAGTHARGLRCKREGHCKQTGKEALMLMPCLPWDLQGHRQ
eukprot:356165-Pelagomonas_calceolata.AAC.3